MMRAADGGIFRRQHFHVVAKVLEAFLTVVVAALVAQLEQDTLHVAYFSLQALMISTVVV